MKRAAALAAIKAAGATHDKQAMLRLYVENRISYAAAMKAYSQGAAWMRHAAKSRTAEADGGLNE